MTQPTLNPYPQLRSTRYQVSRLSLVGRRVSRRTNEGDAEFGGTVNSVDGPKKSKKWYKYFNSNGSEVVKVIRSRFVQSFSLKIDEETRGS